MKASFTISVTLAIALSLCACTQPIPMAENGGSEVYALEPIPCIEEKAVSMHTPGEDRAVDSFSMELTRKTAESYLDPQCSAEEAENTASYTELTPESAGVDVPGGQPAPDDMGMAVILVKTEPDTVQASTAGSMPTSTAWKKTPEQQAAVTPIPKISVDFVITCPPEPSTTPEPLPEQPTAPEPAPGSSSAAWQPRPTSAPVVTPEPAPAPTVSPEPAVPEPKPSAEAPAPTPTPEPATTSKPSGGYAVCSCGATILPDELVAHMKAHALNGESHSYVAH